MTETINLEEILDVFSLHLPTKERVKSRGEIINVGVILHENHQWDLWINKNYKYTRLLVISQSYEEHAYKFTS